MAAFLIPPWYVADILKPGGSGVLLATFIFGFSMAVAVFDFAKALRQTWIIQKKRQSWVPNAYVVLIWVELLTCIAYAVITWVYLVNFVQAR
jgi:hypothetical protein